MNKIFQFFREAYAELMRVTWPSRSTTTQYTILVVIISLGVAAFLGTLDYLFGWGIKEYLLPRAQEVAPLGGLPEGVVDISPEDVPVEVEVDSGTVSPTETGEIPAEAADAEAGDAVTELQVTPEENPVSPQ